MLRFQTQTAPCVFVLPSSIRFDSATERLSATTNAAIGSHLQQRTVCRIGHSRSHTLRVLLMNRGLNTWTGYWRLSEDVRMLQGNPVPATVPTQYSAILFRLTPITRIEASGPGYRGSPACMDSPGNLESEPIRVPSYWVRQGFPERNRGIA